MIWANIAWAFLQKHWRKLAVVGVIVVIGGGIVHAYAAYTLRGAKIERLEVKLETAEAKLRSCQTDREACAEIADALTVQQAETARWIEKARKDREEYDAALDAAFRANRLIRDRIEAQSKDTIEAVRRAEGCENKVTALARALVGDIQ